MRGNVRNYKAQDYEETGKLVPLGVQMPENACQKPKHIKESTNGAVRSAASVMDGCGEAGEAQGTPDGSNFVSTLLQLRSNFARSRV